MTALTVAPKKPRQRRKKPAHYVLPGRTPRESTVYYLTFYNFFLVDYVYLAIIRVFPRLKPYLLAVIYLVFSAYWYRIIQLAFSLENAHYYVIPVTTWITGTHDFRGTPWPTLNALVSIAVFATTVPAILHVHFVLLGFIYLGRRVYQWPRLYDLNPCSWIPVALMTAGLLYVVITFKYTYGDGMVMYLVTTVILSELLGMSTGVGQDTVDPWLLYIIRLTGVWISRVFYWIVINVTLLSMFGAPILAVVNKIFRVSQIIK